MPRTAANESCFSIRIGDVDFLVVEFTAIEKISTLYTVELSLASEEDVALIDIIGKEGALRLSWGVDSLSDRFFHGIISDFRQTGNRGCFYLYKAFLVPAIYLLSLRRNCRIFQDMSVPDIVKQITKEARIPEDQIIFRLLSKYRKREYCVQYRESDLNFISRLLEDEGIFYFFTHSQDKHEIIFGDDAGIYKKINGNADVNFNPASGLLKEKEVMLSFEPGRRLYTDRITLTDYYYEKPAVDLTCHKEEPNGNALEIFDFPGDYKDTNTGRHQAKIRLEEASVFKVSSEGKSNCVHFTTGHTFSLKEHDRPDVDGDYLLVQVRHKGQQPQVLGEHADTEAEFSYINDLIAIPATTTYRPPRSTPKARMEGIQSAFVVGPKNEEIYTDKYGRVKVKFHWDRNEQVADEKRTCWIRVGQAMAGPGWGSLFLPRVGHEVIVQFMDGDPDWPIITGQVYHGTNLPPYTLPDEKTKSFIKTNSSTQDNGFNEIRFEDKKGAEQLFIHAQKNMDLRVKNDQFETVEHDCHLVVENDKKEHIKNERHEIIDKHHKEQIGGDRHIKVTGKQAIEVGGKVSLTAKGDLNEVLNANHYETVSSDYNLKASNAVIEGQSNITLKAGGSYIAIESGGIKLGSSGRIVIDAQADVEVKGASQVTINGGIVKIN